MGTVIWQMQSWVCHDQVDTSPENVDLEDDEEEECMSQWVNSLTI